MGLVKQIDDHIGRLLAFLKESGRLDDTLIVFTSDHGDYLGDHWLGEKDLFHDPSVKIPLIVYDPSESANTTRGQVRDELVESIDLIPTFIDILGGKAQPQRLEGRSLLPFLRDEPIDGWRSVAISEYDYAILPSGAALKKNLTSASSSWPPRNAGSTLNPAALSLFCSTNMQTLRSLTI